MQDITVKRSEVGDPDLFQKPTVIPMGVARVTSNERTIWDKCFFVPDGFEPGVFIKIEAPANTTGLVEIIGSMRNTDNPGFWTHDGGGAGASAIWPLTINGQEDSVYWIPVDRGVPYVSLAITSDNSHEIVVQMWAVLAAVKIGGLKQVLNKINSWWDKARNTRGDGRIGHRP